MDPYKNLTRYQRQVLSLIAKGLTDQAIATELSRTKRSVGITVTYIYRKLELSDPQRKTHPRVKAALWFSHRFPGADAHDPEQTGT